MPDDGIHSMDQPVPEDATGAVQEPITPEVPAEKVEPRLLTTEELRERSKFVLTPEGRLQSAKPFPVPSWECELMIAGTTDLAVYERLFGNIDNLLKGAATPNPDDIEVDRAFIKAFIISCVVQPEVDEEMLDNLLQANIMEFSMLAAFCMAMSQKDPTEAVVARLGALDTEAQERFFAAFPGFMNEQMPA